MSGWTIDTLKEHYDQRFADLAHATADAKHSIERAEDAAGVTRAYAEEKNNEFRAQLADQAAMFMPRSEADQRYATTMQSQAEARSNTQRMCDDLGGAQRRSIDELRASLTKICDEIRDTGRSDIADLRKTGQKAADELRRLVYIATGIALAAGVAIPLLLRR